MPFPGAAARVEPMTGAHAAAVLAIYQAGIEDNGPHYGPRVPTGSGV